MLTLLTIIQAHCKAIVQMHYYSYGKKKCKCSLECWFPHIQQHKGLPILNAKSYINRTLSHMTNKLKSKDIFMFLAEIFCNATYKIRKETNIPVWASDHPVIFITTLKKPPSSNLIDRSTMQLQEFYSYI